MFIDSKGKLFGKVSIVDILIAVLILGVIAGVGYKFRKSNTATPFAKKDTIQVTFYQSEANNFIGDNIKAGDPVKDKATGSVFGKVVSVKNDKAVSTGTNSEGQMVLTSDPKKNAITVVVEGEGILGTQGASFDNTDFFINSSVELRIGSATYWASITKIEKKG